jgi:hypothetical protein
VGGTTNGDGIVAQTGAAPCPMTIVVLDVDIGPPPGFEHCFDELAAGVGSPEEYRARYGSQVDLDRTRRICEQHGPVFPINE